MTELKQPGSYPLAVAAALEMAEMCGRFAAARIEADRIADEYRARLERQGAEYWRARDERNG